MILRMVRKLAFAVAVMTAVLSGGTAYATVIWDYSPATTRAAIVPGFPYYYPNQAVGQNFAEIVSFALDATVTGIDIYSLYPVSLWQLATVRLWSDNGAGAPVDLLKEINTSISIVDDTGAVEGFTRKHADITTPLLLSAGTNYWIGMSGRDGSELGQAGLKTVDDGYMARFGGKSFSGLALAGDMAFRLEGTINAVPEPGTFILLGAGLGGLALYRRRQRY